MNFGVGGRRGAVLMLRKGGNAVRFCRFRVLLGSVFFACFFLGSPFLRLDFGINFRE